MSIGYPLVILSGCPYAGSGARAALDLALGFAVFNQAPRLLFTGDALLQLIEHDSEGLGRRSLRKLIDSLPLYDIDELFAQDSDLAGLGISPGDLPTQVTVLDTPAVRELHEGAGHLLSL